MEGGSKYQNWQSKSRRKANSGAGSGSRSIEEDDNLQRQGWPSAGGDGKGFREKKKPNPRGLKKNVNKLTSKGRQNWYEGQGFQPQLQQHIQQFGRQERKGKGSRKKERGSGWRRLEDDDDYDDDNSGNDDDNSGNYDDYGGEDGDGGYDSGSGWNQF